MTTATDRPSGAISAIPVIALVATLGASYVVSQLLRTSIGVIAPDLATEMAISASELGVLSSAFFFSFAAMQLPLGVAIDRYGPKRCMLVCAIVVIAGALLFAVASTPSGLVFSRILMGIGTSCYLMAPLALYARRFPPERFAVFAGVQLGLGSIGALIATAPLAFAAATIGWRTTFVVIAGAMVIIGALITLVVADPTANPGAEASRETVRQSVTGVREALRLPSVGKLFLMHMATYSSFVVFVGLWGGPYLTHVYGYGLTERGNLLLIPAVTQVLGSFVWGSMDRLFAGYKVPALIGAGLTCASMATLAWFGRFTPFALNVWLVVFGFCTAFTPVVIAHGKSLFPQRLVGRGITLLNMGTMGGAFVAQLVSGMVIDLFPVVGGAYPLIAYRLVFGLQVVFVLCAMFVYLRSHDPLNTREA